jgi:hypothetical protein
MATHYLLGIPVAAIGGDSHERCVLEDGLGHFRKEIVHASHMT